MMSMRTRLTSAFGGPGAQVEQPRWRVDDEPSRGDVNFRHDRGHERDQELSRQPATRPRPGRQCGTTRAAAGLGRSRRDRGRLRRLRLGRASLRPGRGSGGRGLDDEQVLPEVPDIRDPAHGLARGRPRRARSARSR